MELQVSGIKLGRLKFTFVLNKIRKKLIKLLLHYLQIKRLEELEKERPSIAPTNQSQPQPIFTTIRIYMLY